MNDYKIIDTEFSEHMADSYVQYAKEVLEGRAIPSANDGLKPVQRRILQSLYSLGLHPNSQYKKCARAVGDCLGKLHPHGDQSVYDAMVIMAQDFKQKYPMVDIHGNSGSIDGDPAAAMRYTECRLSPFGEVMMADIDKNTVDMVPNYDESEMEASELPGLYPLLLMNGTSGIAVGMATSFVPHLAKDVFKAIDVYLENCLNGEDTPDDVLINIIKAPDFPTGGIITNLKGIRKAYKEGKGSVRIRARYTIEEKKNGSESIIVTEIPYGIIKTKLVMRIDELRKNDVIEDIREVRDESSKEGIRIVIDLKKNADSQRVINSLLKLTDLETNVSMNHQAIVNGSVQEGKLSLKDIIECFIDHAFNVVKRKSQFILDKEEKRYHIIEGFLKIAPSILEVVELITEAETDEDIFSVLSEEYELDEEQINAIISRQLRSLKKISEREYQEEAEKLSADIERLTKIVSDDMELIAETKRVLLEVADRFKNEKRQTEIQDGLEIVLDDIDLIKKEDIIMIRYHSGIIKCVKASEYNAQNRGGKGCQVRCNEDDFIEDVITMTTHDELLIFSSLGKMYKISAYKIPIVSKMAMGKYISNYVELEPEEKVVAVLPVSQDIIKNENNSIFMMTEKGIAKRLSYEDLPQKKNGTKAMNVADDDKLMFCIAVTEGDNIFIASSSGLGIKTSVNNFRIMGRNAGGVRTIKLEEDEKVIGAITVRDDDIATVVSENGLGKKINFQEFDEKGRVGKGRKYYTINERSGKVASIVNVKDDENLIATTMQGMIVKVNLETVRTMGSAATGVKLVNLAKDDKVVSVAACPKEDSEEEPVSE